MLSLPRFEANLLHVLRFFLRKVPPEQALPLVLNPCARPPCLSRPSVELVQDSLAKGCPLLLARLGGWHRERFLRNEGIREGRLWERTEPASLGLAFSRHSLSFLIWITATQLPGGKPWRNPPHLELAAGDLLLFYLAFSALRSTPIGPVLKAHVLFRRHALCRLAFPEDFADLPADVVPDFVPWTNGAEAFMLEVLQAEFSGCWFQVERSKAGIREPQAIRVLGKAQEQVLAGFFQAVETAGRPDLARFLLQAVARLLANNPSADAWVGGLNLTGQRLADRIETYRAALVLLRNLARLGEWERRARAVGYFDDGYAAGQMLKADWEHWQGNLLLARIRNILREVEPLTS